MRSGWRQEEARRWAAATPDPVLGLRVYTSRLLGAEPSLVLHGGGNTSAKSERLDLFGEPVAVLYSKGSGWDLASIEPAGFTPLDLPRVRRLLELERLSDREMVAELRRHRLDPEAPTPSVETLLHADLPHRFVDHTHADAVLALIQTPDGRRRAEELAGDELLLIPYVKPGFDLARAVKLAWDGARAAGREPIGLLLLHHGVFTFADEARESYERMIAVVDRAERAARRRGARVAAPAASAGLRTSGAAALKAAGAAELRAAGAAWGPVEIAGLRAALSRQAGRPMVLRLDDSLAARRFASHPEVARLATRGPLTPDHVLRTKRVAAVVAAPAAAASALERYARDYRRYFERHAGGRELTMLDPAPRVVVAPGAGVFAAGESAAAARVVAEIYRHTFEAILLAERLGGYRPLPARDTFEVEYWELEQAKLARGGRRLPLAGRVALVTGAASGIGRASAAALAEAGAAVAGVDLAATGGGDAYLGLTADVTDPAALRRAIAATVRRFGGLDVVVSNVGVFPAGTRIEALDDATWRRVMALNVDSHLALLRETAPLLARAPGGGAVVLVGSKNVPAPGPGAAAYSASKAALTQLGRVAALELAAANVRVNILHPDGVFDTAAWTPEVLADRAAAYGLSVDQYRRRNLLGAEVTSADVGRLAAALATDLFAKTTGAQIPVDGGNDRVI